jgi:hypothetical protein
VLCFIFLANLGLPSSRQAVSGLPDARGEKTYRTLECRLDHRLGIVFRSGRHTGNGFLRWHQHEMAGMQRSG